jgi:hypothetical protein
MKLAMILNIYIISKNKDILNLGTYHSIPIVGWYAVTKEQVFEISWAVIAHLTLILKAILGTPVAYNSKQLYCFTLELSLLQ